MRKYFWFLLTVFCISCGRNDRGSGDKIITVSIAPFKYFVEEIAGGDFKVNVMVPAGADPHVYEPFPEQINKLRKSVAYISNGFLGFEMIWLDRFYETNKTMKRLSLGDKIVPLTSEHQHEGDHVEAADPHYWMSPTCAMIMASSIKELLCELNQPNCMLYEKNYQDLILNIEELDNKARELFSDVSQRSFMVFHPNFGYLARDYGLEEIPVEYDGKEPTPSRMKELIDYARANGIKTIFVQREYDSRNAKSIADEIGAEVKIIDPLSEEWMKAANDIIIALYLTLKGNSK